MRLSKEHWTKRKICLKSKASELDQPRKNHLRWHLGICQNRESMSDMLSNDQLGTQYHLTPHQPPRKMPHAASWQTIREGHHCDTGSGGTDSMLSHGITCCFPSANDSVGLLGNEEDHHHHHQERLSNLEGDLAGIVQNVEHCALCHWTLQGGIRLPWGQYCKDSLKWFLGQWEPSLKLKWKKQIRIPPARTFQIKAVASEYGVLHLWLRFKVNPFKVTV